jgi:diguanylate cyclase (GGDEF)-like protein/PAS domain S-box-containing protein
MQHLRRRVGDESSTDPAAAAAPPAVPAPPRAGVPALQDGAAHFRAAFDCAPVGMALLSRDLHFLQANHAMRKLLGRSAGQLCGQHRDAVSYAGDCAGEDRELARLVDGSAAVVEFEKRFLDAQGQPVWALVSAALLPGDDAPDCFVYQVYDLRRRKEVERRLSTLACTDPLTGLANRRFWRQEADRRLAAARGDGRSIAVLFLDLDHFKRVNDALGHGAGDELLRQVAQRLRAAVRSSDVVARYGGDEFLVLLTDLASRSDVAIVARKLVEAVTAEFELEAGRTQVGLSVGAAVFPFDGLDTSSLLQAADGALYGAKARGRNRVQFSVPLLEAAED